MKQTLSIFAVIMIFTASFFAQGFKVKASGEQNFRFTDNKNQATFFSTTPFEDITGLTNDVKGSVNFNVSDLKTLKGKLTVSVASIKTGIEMRDGHLQSAGWLNAESYPEIIFEIKNISDIKPVADNKVTAKVTGNFSLHGVTKEVIADATLTYLDESEQTKIRAAGDLLGVQAKFNVKLSDYGVNNKLVGQKVSENIEVSVNVVGSNAK
ncbi:MAG TPA: YceI family protein [Ignavibacteriales bacterium]|nr:YceI family protein [Ignavibacteriales bacterium]